MVWLVIAPEVVPGVLGDVYMILEGYDLPFYVGFGIGHLVIISTGVLVIRQAQGEAEMTGAVRLPAASVYPE